MSVYTSEKVFSIVTLLAIPEMQQIPLRVCVLNILANLIMLSAIDSASMLSASFYTFTVFKILSTESRTSFTSKSV